MNGTKRTRLYLAEKKQLFDWLRLTDFFNMTIERSKDFGTEGTQCILYVNCDDDVARRIEEYLLEHGLWVYDYEAFLKRNAKKIWNKLDESGPADGLIDFLMDMSYISI